MVSIHLHLGGNTVGYQVRAPHRGLAVLYLLPVVIDQAASSAALVLGDRVRLGHVVVVCAPKGAPLR